jgi:pimeloyl-ACP methyl ester carboxylesterase
MFYWLAFGASYFDRNLDALDTALDEYLANPLDQGVFAYQLEACRAHDVRDRLGAVACPALIVHGAEDLLVRPHHARELNAAIPASEVVFLEEGGHCCNWEQPERFRDEVDAFLGS